MGLGSVNITFVYHFIKPDLVFEIFFEKERATGYRSRFWNRRVRHLLYN